MNRFITIGTWAKLAEMTREGAYKRIKSGKLKISEYCEHPLIDTEFFPPTRLKTICQPLKKNDLPF